MFLELTDSSGVKASVNAELIVAIVDRGRNSTLCMVGAPDILVKESRTEILDMIKKVLEV